MFSQNIFILLLILQLFLIHYQATRIRSQTIKSFLVINTWNYTNVNYRAWRVLRQGRAAANWTWTREAVTQGCMVCQEHRCGSFLGRGAAPDATGQITLEAAIMDGSDLRVGAVADLKGIPNTIGVARHVLEYTEHTLLVGAGALRFALAMGYKREKLSTEATWDALTNWHLKNCRTNFWKNIQLIMKNGCPPYLPVPSWKIKQEMHPEYSIKLNHHDHLGILALDSKGSIHVASISNGARFRIPGRVGDSAVPGAGIYADNEVGGALASGDGDVLMRILPALLAVEALRAGQWPDKAVIGVMRRLLYHHTEFNGGLIVVNRWGKYAAACAGLEEFNFVVSEEIKNSKAHPTVAHLKRIKCLDRKEFIDGGPAGSYHVKPMKLMLKD